MENTVIQSLKIERSTIDFQGINLLSRLAVGATLQGAPPNAKIQSVGGLEIHIPKPNSPSAGNRPKETRMHPAPPNPKSSFVLRTTP
jgi:hypothetical protein